ncbi:MAG: hypothetical protein J6D54_07660 [Olsenella sp.]|nr:hypothetical protein [Olsenella sp.]
MPTVIPVKFKYAARDLWFDPKDTGAQEGDHVICTTERGQEIGLATMDAQEVSPERLREVIGEAGRLQPVLRIASDADLSRAEMLAGRAEEAFPTFRRLVHESGLDMKPVGVEYLFGGGKVVCYFSAEERVDFRQLVRDLSRELHERIDMRQIGVREEAAIVGGFAHCGQELCCARFGHQFEPVSIRMAKEQDLPLNSTKISGACGRLMCCLRYEFEAYRDFKQRAPKRNAVIETPLGKAKIVEYDTPKEQLCLRLENGKQVRIPLADMEASEAAHKKSEELGCACRPDTVPRAALEKLQSPDVQMALAEIDRQMGIIPEEAFDSSDIFVESKPRRRRSRRGSSSEQQPQQGRKGSQASSSGESSKDGRSGRDGASEGASGRTRRRRKKGTDVGGQAKGSQQGAQQGSQRGTQEASQPRDGERQNAHRRRRHHSATGATAARAERGTRAQHSAANATSKNSSSSAPAKRRRRPGDHGGQQASVSQKEHSKEHSPRPAEGADGGDKPKRRRRHRGGRGRGKRGDGQGGNGANGGNGGGASAS